MNKHFLNFIVIAFCIISCNNNTDNNTDPEEKQNSIVQQNLKNSTEGIGSVRVLKPLLGKELAFSSQGEIDFNANNNSIDSVNGDKEDYWDVLPIGCSWYCGGGLDSQFASSELSPGNGVDYKVHNIHDLNYKTAWVEGVDGYGIGESVTYVFPAINPRINEIILVNGYVKSEKAWKENSRVKSLKFYYNDSLVGIMELLDCTNQQHFKFDQLFGYSERSDFERLQRMKPWTFRFEILDVYEGSKYDETAITEIYFDGVDVH